MIEKRISEDLIGKVIVWKDPSNSSTVMLKVQNANENFVSGDWAYVKDFPNGEMRFTREYEVKIPTIGGYVSCDIVSERVWDNVANAYNEYIGIRDVLANMLHPTYF